MKRFLLFIFITFGLTLLTINYFSVSPKILLYRYDCSWQDSNESQKLMNCKRSVDEDRRRAISKEINSTINEYKQIGEFSKVVPSVIRYNLSVVNKTDTRINMVAPEDNTKPILFIAIM